MRRSLLAAAVGVTPSSPGAAPVDGAGGQERGVHCSRRDGPSEREYVLKCSTRARALGDFLAGAVILWRRLLVKIAALNLRDLSDIARIAALSIRAESLHAQSKFL